MKVIRDPIDIATVADPGIRELLLQRLQAVTDGEPYEAEEMGYFVVVEPGDSVEAIEAQLGFTFVAENRWGESCTDANYNPGFEYLDEHASCFDMAFVIGDSGFGVLLVVPKHPDIPASLMALCQQFVTQPS